jgi:hypothetical protein
MVADLCLELAYAREHLAHADEDEVEILASRFLMWSRLLGGDQWSPGRARAEAREWIRR